MSVNNVVEGKDDAIVSVALLPVRPTRSRDVGHSQQGGDGRRNAIGCVKVLGSFPTVGGMAFLRMSGFPVLVLLGNLNGTRWRCRPYLVVDGHGGRARDGVR
jgi:hypothetical protein